MDFEWDEGKAASNLVKHGISFIDATAVFDDPFRLELDATRTGDKEWRGKIIGRIGETTIAVVVYTDRMSTIRLISARKAGRHERKIYDQNQAAG